MAELRREHELAPERFLAYKHLLIDYLQQFLDDLFRYRVPDRRSGSRCGGSAVSNASSQLAAAGDDSAGLFVDRDLAARWRRSLDRAGGLVPPRPRQRAATGADDSRGATTVRDPRPHGIPPQADRERHPADHPRRQSCSISPAGSLRSDADEAHRLFDAAFGLAPAHHLGQEEGDPDLTPATASWWEARPRSRCPSRCASTAGAHRPLRLLPPSTTREAKEHLAAEHRQRRAARVEAASRLTARPIGGARAAHAGEFALLPRAARPRASPAPARGRVQGRGRGRGSAARDRDGRRVDAHRNARRVR